MKKVRGLRTSLLYLRKHKVMVSFLIIGISLIFISLLIGKNNFKNVTRLILRRLGVYTEEIRSVEVKDSSYPNGGSLTGYLLFKENNLTTDLSCENETDKFSVSNSKAQLTYPVGLMSSPEMNLLNNRNARDTVQMYWFLSSSYWKDLLANGRGVSYGGFLSTYQVYMAYGVRPAVFLVSGTEYTSGDGSKTSPYVVDTN